MKPQMIAPKFVTWVILLFGAAEVVWVIYLIFNQATSGQGYHLRLASVGLSTALAVSCALTAWFLYSDRRGAAGMGLATATLAIFTGMILTLAPSLQRGGLVTADIVPLLIATVATLGAVVATIRGLGGMRSASRGLILLAVAALVLVAVVGLIRAGQSALASTSTAEVGRTRAMVVFLDTAETISLLGAGYFSLRGRAAPTFVFSVIAAVLFMCDAWVNIVVVPSGQPFQAALVFFFIGELPSIVLCLIAARSATKRMVTAAEAPVAVAA